MTEQARSRTGLEDGPDRYDVVVIGGGQSGLSVGYHLSRAGLRFVILEARGRVGDAWRQRWDSLRLFTPARYNGLDGMPFPTSPDYFPTKDEMGDYLESYAARFDLPVRTGERVVRVWRDAGADAAHGADGSDGANGFLIETASGAGRRRYAAGAVVVAMASYQRPKVPDFAGELAPDIVQLHSFEYRNPDQLGDGPVLLVGAGNSGSEIAMELSRDHEVFVSGRHTGHLPFRIAGLPGRYLFVPLVLRVLFHRLFTVRTPVGRKLRTAMGHKGGPLIRVRPSDLRRAGVEWLPRMAGVREGRPVLEDGRVLDVANVVWCTGFHPGFDWLDLPVHGDFEPRHHSGVADDVEGLYFVGLHFLHALSSGMVHGVGRDAKRIVDEVVRGGAGRRDEADQPTRPLSYA